MTTDVLERPVLILNRHWNAIHTTTMKEAIGLVAKGSAKIIDPQTYEQHTLFTWNDVSKAKKMIDEVIRSAHLAIAPLEVILLTKYEGIAERGVIFSRKNLFKRDHYTCQYCGAQPGLSELTIDHVLPRSRGGISSWINCVLACVECNKKKSDHTPDEVGMKLRSVPRKPSWKALQQIPPSYRRASWDAFVSEAYWTVQLEP